MICSKCGTVLDDDAVFCYKCGSFEMDAGSVRDIEAMYAEPAGKRKRHGRSGALQIRIVLCILIPLFAAAAVIVGYRSIYQDSSLRSEPKQNNRSIWGESWVPVMWAQ